VGAVLADDRIRTILIAADRDGEAGRRPCGIRTAGVEVAVEDDAARARAVALVQAAESIDRGREAFVDAANASWLPAVDLVADLGEPVREQLLVDMELQQPNGEEAAGAV